MIKNTQDWPYTLYKGKQFFDFYVKLALKFQSLLGVEESQEVYLGYNPDEDYFYSGYDMWPDVGYDTNYYDDDYDDYDNFEGYDYGIGNVVRFKLSLDSKGKWVEHDVTILDFSKEELFYPNGYKKLHATYSNILDIRLD